MASILQDTPLAGSTDIPGDAKSGFQTTDHRGWIILNGRLKSTLTSAQQVNATALGFGSNLPDATGRVFAQGTLGAAVGSSTISQSNLPNINLTATAISAGTPSGSVSLITHSSDAGGFDPTPFGGTSNLQQTDRIPENTITLGASIGGGFTGNALSAHAHVVPLGGLGSAYMPAAIGVNQFVYLGN
jgi:hypothetical protein